MDDGGGRRRIRNERGKSLMHAFTCLLLLLCAARVKPPAAPLALPHGVLARGFLLTEFAEGAAATAGAPKRKKLRS